MVRVKYRYLVVNFLYPEPAAKSRTQLPDVVQIHSPTPDAFHLGQLIRMIREEVADLYGDYGMGMVSSGLKGMCSLHSLSRYTVLSSTQLSTGRRPPRPPLSAALATTTRWYGLLSHTSRTCQSPWTPRL
jgi:hypothetical protein